MRRLREEGLVIAGRGRTPRRAEPLPIEQPLGELYSLFTAVEATGRVQRSVVRTLDVRADGVVAARLGLEESTPLVHLERLRLADAEPLAIDRVWMPERLAAPLLDADFARTALYDEYAARCGMRVTGGQRGICAPWCRTPRSASCSARGRRWRRSRSTGSGCAGAQAVEWRHTLVRGDRFSVTARFSAPRATGSAAPDQWPEGGTPTVDARAGTTDRLAVASRITVAGPRRSRGQSKFTWIRTMVPSRRRCIRTRSASWWTTNSPWPTCGRRGRAAPDQRVGDPAAVLDLAGRAGRPPSRPRAGRGRPASARGC